MCGLTESASSVQFTSIMSWRPCMHAHPHSCTSCNWMCVGNASISIWKWRGIHSRSSPANFPACRKRDQVIQNKMHGFFELQTTHTKKLSLFQKVSEQKQTELQHTVERPGDCEAITTKWSQSDDGKPTAATRFF